MKITIILICLQSIFIHVFSQKNFLPGRIQKIDGQIVKGLIDYRQWDENPVKIRFKEDQGYEILYAASDINWFEVTGRDTYVSAVVTKDIRPVKYDEITVETKDSVVTDTVFLRELVFGDKLSLYLLRDNKDHFYVKGVSKSYQELNYKVYLVNNSGANFMDVKPIYKGQLKKFISNETMAKKLERQIDNTGYEEKGLSSFVRMINQTPRPVSNKTGKKKSSFFIAAGPQFSSFHVSGYPALEAMKFSSSTTPVIGAGLDMLSERRLNALRLRFETIYSSMNYRGSKTKPDGLGGELEDSYTVKVHIITAGISVLYSFVRSHSVHIYAGAGSGYSFSSYPISQYLVVNRQTNTTFSKRDNFLVFEKGWVNASIQAGVIVKNKFEISTKAKVFGSFSNYSYIDINPDIYSLQVGYHF
ncbi:MAG: hypothetical protein ABI675_29915 [Chitinophagaceae bacterium]